MKNIYEVFDEFEKAKNKKERMNVIQKNLSKTLTQVLEYTFHPGYQWKINEVPDTYLIREIPAGMSYCQMSTEIRKLYMFQKGNPTAENLTDKKQKELLTVLLESVEPREAEVVMGILRKDQGVKGLDYKFVKEAFPQMLP